MKYFTRQIFIPVVLIVAIIFSISGANNLPSSVKKASAAGPFIASGLQVFTTPGTFTYNIPANAGRLKISAVGGGGVVVILSLMLLAVVAVVDNIYKINFLH